MSAEKQHGKWPFGLSWILANTAGWGLYLVVGWAAGWLLWELYEAGDFRLLANEETRMFLTLATLGFCWGAIVGWLQQFVLTRRFRLEGSKWAWATLIGIVLYTILQGLASVVSALLSYSIFSSYIIDGIGAFAAPLALGIVQWYVLRRYFARSGWWVAATTFALWLGHIAIWILPAGGRTFVSSFIISLLLGGFFYGVATWIVLVVISRQPIASAESE